MIAWPARSRRAPAASVTGNRTAGALFGFMNRWNDSLATSLEAEPVEVAEKFLAGQGWEVGKHGG